MGRDSLNHSYENIKTQYNRFAGKCHVWVLAIKFLAFPVMLW